MKAILISIQPQYVADILNGEKTLEIRKTMPKCDLPIDVYIYCTKDKKYVNLINRGGFLTGMVVAKFTLNKVDKVHLRFEKYCAGELSQDGLLKYACLTEQELDNYLWSNCCIGYAWHIDNLKIFDRPKELSEFKCCLLGHNNCVPHNCQECPATKPLTRAPQSWCFVEV